MTREACRWPKCGCPPGDRCALEHRPAARLRAAIADWTLIAAATVMVIYGAMLIIDTFPTSTTTTAKTPTTKRWRM